MVSIDFCLSGFIKIKSANLLCRTWFHRSHCSHNWHSFCHSSSQAFSRLLNYQWCSWREVANGLRVRLVCLLCPSHVSCALPGHIQPQFGSSGQLLSFPRAFQCLYNQL